MRSSGKIINNKIPEEISTAFANHQYVPIEKIGEGGFCTVFKAKNQKTGQLVAVKTLKRQAKESQESYEKNLIRFNREAELCAKLNHPNIIMLLDRGQRGDVHYSVFELVKGRSLKEALFEHNSLCPVAAADIMSQVLQALFHAHQQGIVHRDIKPANIMLNKQGQKTYVKLLDFGISAHSSNQQAYVSHKPSIDEMTGTMSYVAPEQLRGCLPTPKSDIYAWGLVFLECLTGTRVMSGTCLPSIIQQQLCSNDILLPETIENHPVSDIIKAAIKKDGEKRIEDASELYEKLSHIDLSTLSQSTTTHRQALSTYTDNRNAPQTLIFNDTKTLLDTEQPQAITALCITIALHCNSNAHELIDKKSRETLLRRLYEEKKNQCISVIQKYGATLAGRLVDTLLFYFGYPKPLSTDSLICAKAALEIAQTLNQPVYMDDKRIKIFCTVHIGIHASSFWKGNHAFPDGEIPRTAMTLARSAGANQILCSRPTHDILCSQAYFETSYIEKYYQYNAQSPSYAIIREHGETTVDSLRFKTNLLPLIGHENELNQLAHITALKSDEKQEARCAHIHGEGGIGKSRILAELCLQKSSLAIWSMQCIPQNKNSELSTILSLVKRMYGLNLVSEEKVVIKIKRLLNESSHLDPLRSTAILCSWLNLKPHEARSTSHTAVRSARNELFDILTFLLCKNNSGQLGKKALFILDDMHWLDTTSLQFISEFISSNAFKESGHTLLTSSRQSIPSILYRQIKTVLKIDRLDNDNAMALIAASLNSQQVSRQLTDLIAQRTNGIPFFIIEFVRMLKENNWLQRLNGKVSIIESNSIPLIPYTLRDLLEKRLDNLAGDMKVVQFASAFGEEFGYDALKSSIGSNSVELNTTLDELLKHDLIRVKRSAGKKNFMFKHELLREAAYNSMPQELKQEAQQLIFYSQQKHLLSSNNDIKPVVLTRRTDGNFTQ